MKMPIRKNPVQAVWDEHLFCKPTKVDFRPKDKTKNIINYMILNVSLETMQVMLLYKTHFDKDNNHDDIHRLNCGKKH